MAHGLASTACSPEDPGEHSPRSAAAQIPHGGACGPLQVGMGSNAQTLRSSREKAPSEPRDVMWGPSHGIEAAGAVGWPCVGHHWSWLQSHPEGEGSPTCGSRRRPAAEVA